MSGDSRTSSPVVRFLDSFLQEKNIKWLLGVGTLIVVTGAVVAGFFVFQPANGAAVQGTLPPNLTTAHYGGVKLGLSTVGLHF